MFLRCAVIDKDKARFISFALPHEEAEAVDRIVKTMRERGAKVSRSSLIRDALRRLVAFHREEPTVG